MPLEKRDPAHLWDILVHAKKAVASTDGLCLEDFLADEELLLATERRLEIMGEAARRLSKGSILRFLGGPSSAFAMSWPTNTTKSTTAAYSR